MEAKTGDFSGSTATSALDDAHARLREANRGYADAVHDLVEAEAALRIADDDARLGARRRVEHAQRQAQRAGRVLARAAQGYLEARS